MSRALPGLCSAIGVVARGTDLRSNGFSDGSNVYCCRALSKPGIDTVRPKARGEIIRHAAPRKDRGLDPPVSMLNVLKLRKPWNLLLLTLLFRGLLGR